MQYYNIRGGEAYSMLRRRNSSKIDVDSTSTTTTQVGQKKFWVDDHCALNPLSKPHNTKKYFYLLSSVCADMLYYVLDVFCNWFRCNYLL